MPRTPMSASPGGASGTARGFGALPKLTVAATATERIRLGTLVTSVKPSSPIAG
ncbi:hypothetical protein [Streptomyces sp. NPDC094049]|uniref:hypothetical protein n=1 Tax=Streptomyces sp. NPDC094049 TaxID=3154987 RepID=UPI00332C1C7B